MDVVEDLRKKTTDIDGVGRGESNLSSELLVPECVFNQPLAIVEGAVDFKGADVTAQGCELPLL